MQEINNQLNPKTNQKLNFPNNNQIIRRLKKEYFLSPLQKNSRNKKNFFNKYMKIKDDSRIIKKVNVSKYDEEILRRYKGSLLAIKEYFNIK